MRRSVVISVHGIRTRGAWQKELVPILNGAGHGAHPLDYGFFWAIAFLFPFARRRKVDWFMEELTKLKDYETCDIIAHSFGTYIVASAMELYPEVRCRRLILCGSIVRRDFPWKALQERKQVERVLNDYGRLDLWSRISEWMVRDAGQSGFRGFDKPDSSVLTQREHSNFRHSDYFYPVNYTNNWLPFLAGHEPPPTVPLQPGQTNLRFRATFITATLALLSILAAFFFPRGSPAPPSPGSATTAGPAAPASVVPLAPVPVPEPSQPTLVSVVVTFNTGNQGLPHSKVTVKLRGAANDVLAEGVFTQSFPRLMPNPVVLKKTDAITKTPDRVFDLYVEVDFDEKNTWKIAPSASLTWSKGPPTQLVFRPSELNHVHPTAVIPLR